MWYPRAITASRQASRTKRSSSTMSRLSNGELSKEGGAGRANVRGAMAAVIGKHPVGNRRHNDKLGFKTDRSAGDFDQADGVRRVRRRKTMSGESSFNSSSAIKGYRSILK